MDLGSNDLFGYFLTLVLVVLMCVLWYYHHVRLHSHLETNLPPGSFGFPVVGETVTLAMQRVNFFKERHKKYGNVFKTHLFFRPTIRVCGAENIKIVLKGENTIVTSFWPHSVRCLFGKHSLAMSTGAEHRQRKRDVMRALTGESLNVYRSAVADIVSNTMREWSDSCSIKLSEVCNVLALRLILFALYGDAISKDAMTTLAEPVSTIWNNFLCIPIYFPGTGYYKLVAARKQLADYFVELAEKLNQRRDTTDLHPILENILTSEKNNGEELGQLVKDKLTDNTIELLLSGRVTVATLLLCTLILLDEHPEVVKKIQKELTDYSLEDNELTPLRDIGGEKLAKLEYMDHVVNEALRVLPPAGGGYRKVLRSFEVGGYHVPEGWAVTFSIRETHDGQNIPEPRKFNPDRWDRNNSDRPDKDRFSYVPFGAGSRSCPGKQYAKMIAKLFLIELVRTKTWSILDKYKLIRYPMPKTEPDVRVSFSRKKISSDEPGMNDCC